jgi:hypothetical protein
MIPKIKSTNVVFPAPEVPTIDVMVPGGISKVTSETANISSFEYYLQRTGQFILSIF